MNVVRNSLPTFIHWFSLTISSVASLFFLFFLVTEDIPGIISGDSSFVFVALFMVIAIIGSVLSFFKQKPGSLAMMAGGIGMVAATAVQHGMAEFGIMFIYTVSYIFSGLFLFLMTLSSKS